MARSEYRNALRDTYSVKDIKELDKSNDDTEYILLKEAESIMDDIESDINNILNEISNISGLTEIDSLSDSVKELSERLY